MFGGDVCINQGMITGFGSPSCFTVIAYYNDVLTVQAKIDLFRVYIFILMIFLSLMLAASFGRETINTGVYSIP